MQVTTIMIKTYRNRIDIDYDNSLRTHLNFLLSAVDGEKVLTLGPAHPHNSPVRSQSINSAVAMGIEFTAAATRCCSNLGIMISSAILLIFAIKYDSEDNCNILGIIEYMKIAGALGLTLTMLESVISLLPFGLHLLMCIYPIFALGQITITVWGSVLAFTNYSSWTMDPEEKQAGSYCSYPIFMCLLVVIIIRWVLLLIHYCTRRNVVLSPNQ